MKDKIKKFTQLFSLLAIIFFAAGSYLKSEASTSHSIPDYTGKWDFAFYDASGKLQGKKTINISDDGTLSEKAVMNLGNTIYHTLIEGSISSRGKVQDGTLTDADTFKMEGSFTGSFTGSEGSGEWKNYYSKSGTWKAVRSSKNDKQE